jgi:hypothetical protein
MDHADGSGDASWKVGISERAVIDDELAQIADIANAGV